MACPCSRIADHRHATPQRRDRSFQPVQHVPIRPWRHASGASPSRIRRVSRCFFLIEYGSAVERNPVVEVDLTLQHLFRFGEAIVCFIAGGEGDTYAQEGEN